jgi:hypothetical protein
MRTILVSVVLLLSFTGAAAAAPDILQAVLSQEYGMAADEAGRISAAARGLSHEAGRIDRVTLERLLGDCRRGGVSPEQLPRMLAAWGRYRERLLAVGEAPVWVRQEVRTVTQAVLAERDRTPPAERLERMIGRRLGKHAVLEDDRSAVNKKDKDKEKYKHDGGYGGSRGKKPKKND